MVVVELVYFDGVPMFRWRAIAWLGPLRWWDWRRRGKNGSGTILVFPRTYALLDHRLFS